VVIIDGLSLLFVYSDLRGLLNDSELILIALVTLCVVDAVTGVVRLTHCLFGDLICDSCHPEAHCC